MFGPMTAYFRFVLRHRLLVSLLLLSVTVLSLFSARRAVVASSLEKMFFGESPAYTEYVERVHLFGTEEVNVFAFETPELLSAEQLEQLERITERLEALEEVDRAYSVLDVQHITSDGSTIQVNTYAEEALADPSQRPGLIAALIDDPLAAGLVVSGDGAFSAVLVEILPDKTRPAEALPALREAIFEAFYAEGLEPTDIRSAGLMITINEAISQTHYSLRTIFPIVIVVLLITVWLMFRRLWPALVSLVVSFLAVVWTAGFAVAVDHEINIMIAMVPAVVLVVGFSDVVHLCSAYLLELGDGLDKEHAIVRSAEDVGKACFFTSVTTFVGFLCLSLIPTPMFRYMGVILGFGVAVALLIAMTLVPILFSWMSEPKPLRRGATSGIHRFLDSVLGQMEKLGTGRPRTVIAVSAAFLALSLVGISQLDIEADFAKRLGDDNKVRVDTRWFEEHFAGTSALDIVIEVPDREGLLDPDRYGQVVEFQNQLNQLPEVERAFSLVDLMDRLYNAYSPDRAVREPYPTSRSALTQLLSLFEGSGKDLDRLVDFNRQTMRITLRLRHDGVRAHSAAGRKAEMLASQILGAGVSVEPSGLTYLLGDWLDEILAGQRRGLALSIVMITIMMFFALASVRAAVISMLPNIFPLLVLGGFLGLFYDYVDSDCMAIALLAVGIGVDDTIHFLVRFRIEVSRGADRSLALQRTYAFAGRAIVMTTVILVAGFFPFALSGYYGTQIMGTLLPICLIVALLADLLLVPALAAIGFIRFDSSQQPG